MQNNSDLFAPIPVDISSSNALLYQLNDAEDAEEKYVKSNDFYSFGMDGFTMSGIDDMATGMVDLSPIQEETSCSLNVPPLEPLFSPVDPVPPPHKFSNSEVDAKPTAVKQITCDLCPETFPSNHVLNLHRQEHIRTKEFPCPKCSASYNFETNLRVHMASHMPISSLGSKQCPVCKMEFKRLAAFKGHLMTHQTSDRFKCNRCNTEFELKVYYEKHMAKAHKPGADGTVEEILASVATKARSRLKNNKSQGKYSCQTCGKNFIKPCLLKRHEVSHTGTKPFQCTECRQAFTQKTSLDRHMRLHQGVRDYKCPKCDCSFAQKNNLIVHIKRTHPIHPNLDQMYPCEYCSCVFTKLNSVNRHQAIAHPEKPSSTEDTSVDDEDGNVNVAKVMEQLKSFIESMSTIDMQPPALELSLLKPPSPGPQVRTVEIVDTLNPKREKTYKTVKEITYKGEKTLACPYCDKPFKKQFDLVRHIRTHTKERLFECNVCHKSFSTRAALKLHENIHLSNQEKPAKLFVCVEEECGKRFSSMRKLDFHTKTHTNSISYICPLCSKSFTSKSGFSAHKHHEKDQEFDMLRPLLMPPVKLNTDDLEEADKIEEYAKRKHQCYICGQKMQKLSHLRQHEATHMGAKPFKCPTCFRSYTTQSCLNQHIKIHSANKPFMCELCNSRFITPSLLKRHMISHSDERLFACPYCNERFKTSDNCKNHILTHARSLLSSTAFSQEDEQDDLNEPFDDTLPLSSSEDYSQSCLALVQHPQNQPKFIELEMVKNCKSHNHKNFTIETVPNGSKKKSVKQSLARSLKQINQNGHLCGECGKIFYKASDLQRHARTHTKEKPFQCDMCSKQFALMSTLVQHKKTHDTKRETYTCQVCGKKYTSQKVLVVHLRIHTGERPFQCGLCKKTFRTSGHKISHMKAHHKKRR